MPSAILSSPESALAPATEPDQKPALLDSINRLSRWLDANNYQGYDPFDGLNARFLRPLTFESPLLRIVLQQSVRRFPLNLRPFLGIRRNYSTKGMGFLARGFIRMHQLTGEKEWEQKARFALEWLTGHQSKSYTGACWGNHFDYQSRSTFEMQDAPSVVWTSLIGHAFLDAYENFGTESFLNTVVSSCEHIIHDLGAYREGDTVCIHYFPTSRHQVHNANTLGASLLARTYLHTRNEAYRALAEKAIRYTAKYQRADGSWYYGEAANLHWVDNFHTAYVLDCFKIYGESTGDTQFDRQLTHGYNYWKKTFFLADGKPKYYSQKTMPLDIQCSSQAIDTLVFFSSRDPESLDLAMSVARWTIANMQDRSGYFYYRRYSPWLVNKTPTLHWGQATMFCALAGLLKARAVRN
jgi:polysaccharide biosynthesis protein VpsJ